MSSKRCDHEKKAQTTALRLIKIRFRSEQELRQRLRLKKIPKVAIEKTISYLKNIGLIDDTQFAKDWIQARLYKNFGINRIKLELQQKEISKAIIDKELAVAEKKNDEEAIVQALIEKRIKRYRGLEPIVIKRRLYSYLARKGFLGETILRALNQS
ncbi:MAG: regulatory protein RecX [Candidatus Aceula meridiana]|nr:regulatory protein RecX [Candidatus Aceula meridiana]